MILLKLIMITKDDIGNKQINYVQKLNLPKLLSVYMVYKMW